MFYFKYLIVAVAIFAAGSNAQSLELGEKEMDLCISAAENEWGFAGFNKDVLKRQCDCAKANHHGAMPVKSSSWKKSGKNSPMYTLVQCARNDLIGFYGGPELEGEMKQLKKQGLENNVSAVKKAEKFSICVGEISYREILRMSAIANLQSARLDKARHQKMYRLCEAESNSLN
jgi:hypothetical protein